MGNGCIFRQVHRRYCIWGCPQHLCCHPTPHTRVSSMNAVPPAHVSVSLSKRGSKFLLMLMEIKLAVHFIGSKGCICSLGEEAHLVNFHQALAREITLSSFVSNLDRFYSALIPPGLCCHNFIGFMVAAGLPCGIV